jgi:hypothetical protein
MTGRALETGKLQNTGVPVATLTAICNPSQVLPDFGAARSCRAHGITWLARSINAVIATIERRRTASL